MDHVKISDCAVVLQGKNVDKKYLNTDGKGLPYTVGANRIRDRRLYCCSPVSLLKLPGNTPLLPI